MASIREYLVVRFPSGGDEPILAPVDGKYRDFKSRARVATACAAIPPKEIPMNTAPASISFSASRAASKSFQLRPGSAGHRIHWESWPGSSWYGAKDSSAPTPGKK